jgi:hypothetical protein
MNTGSATGSLQAHSACRCQCASIQDIPVRVLRLKRSRVRDRPTRQLRACRGYRGHRHQRCRDQSFECSHSHALYCCSVRRIRASDHCYSVENASWGFRPRPRRMCLACDRGCRNCAQPRTDELCHGDTHSEKLGMSDSCFVTVQLERKRLMPAGIENMLVDLTDVVTQMRLENRSCPGAIEMNWRIRSACSADQT